MKSMPFIVALIASWLLGMGVFVWTLPQGIRTEEVTFTNHYGMPLRARLYLPQSGSGRLPGAVLCMGILSNKEMFHVFAISLALRGIVVLVPDWHGAGESPPAPAAAPDDDYHGDLQATVAYLRTRGEVDKERLAVVGHSMGATIAVDAAADLPGVHAVVTYGMDSTSTRAPNLMMIAGLYDEIYPAMTVISSYRGMVQDDKASPGDMRGDFATGTARRLVLVPVSHSMENTTPMVIDATGSWLAQSWGGLEPPATSYWSPDRILAAPFLLWGGLGLVILTLSPLSGSLAGSRLPTLVLASFGLGIVPLLAPILPPVWAADGALGLWVAAVGVNLLRRVRHEDAWDEGVARFLRAYVWIGLLYLVLAVLFALVLAINARAAVLMTPGGLATIPAFIARFSFSLPWIALQGIRPWIFHSYSLEPVPRIGFWIIWALEIALPGWMAILYARVRFGRSVPLLQ